MIDTIIIDTQRTIKVIMFMWMELWLESHDGSTKLEPPNRNVVVGFDVDVVSDVNVISNVESNAEAKKPSKTGSKVVMVWSLRLKFWKVLKLQYLV